MLCRCGNQRSLRSRKAVWCSENARSRLQTFISQIAERSPVALKEKDYCGRISSMQMKKTITQCDPDSPFPSQPQACIRAPLSFHNPADTLACARVYFGNQTTRQSLGDTG